MNPSIDVTQDKTKRDMITQQDTIQCNTSHHKITQDDTTQEDQTMRKMNSFGNKLIENGMFSKAQVKMQIQV